MSQGGILSEASSAAADIETITGNTGGAVGPNGSFNVFLVGSGGVAVTGDPGTNTLTITDATSFVYVDVDSTPYPVTGTDEFLSVNTSTGIKTVQLPNAPSQGVYFIVKDRTGNAGANNISVTTVGGVVTIDGSTTYTMASNYQAISLLFNGTSYEVF